MSGHVRTSQGPQKHLRLQRVEVKWICWCLSPIW